MKLDEKRYEERYKVYHKYKLDQILVFPLNDFYLLQMNRSIRQDLFENPTMQLIIKLLI